MLVEFLISNHQKNTSSSFFEVNDKLYNFKDINGKHHPIIKKEQYEFIKENKEELEKMIDYTRDYLIDYFGFKTLERAYFFRINGKILERPQHMWMRVAVCIHMGNLEKIKNTYDLMSQKYFTHATPTLFNAGTPRPQLSSCYLISMESDSIKGIYNTLGECASISKWAGGIGLHIHNIRSHRVLILEVQMVHQMVLFLCYEFLIILLVMLTRGVEVNVRVVLLFILNRGTEILWNF